MLCKETDNWGKFVDDKRNPRDKLFSIAMKSKKPEEITLKNNPSIKGFFNVDGTITWYRRLKRTHEEKDRFGKITERVTWLSRCRKKPFEIWAKSGL